MYIQLIRRLGVIAYTCCSDLARQSGSL